MDSVPFIEWSKKLELGISKIDFQHRNLVEMINTISEISTEENFATKNRALQSCLERLVEYTVYHFQTEEEVLRKCFYEELPEHKNEHEELTQKVVDFSVRYGQGQDVTKELLDFLKSWLQGHILGSDSKYVSVVKKQFPKL